MLSVEWRCRWELHPRMGVLQTPALLLGYGTMGQSIQDDLADVHCAVGSLKRTEFTIRRISFSSWSEIETGVNAVNE